MEYGPLSQSLRLHILCNRILLAEASIHFGGRGRTYPNRGAEGEASAEEESLWWVCPQRCTAVGVTFQPIIMIF